MLAKGRPKPNRQCIDSESINEIEKNAVILTEYIEEAIENKKQGKEVKPTRNKN